MSSAASIVKGGTSGREDRVGEDASNDGPAEDDESGANSWAVK